MEQAVVDDDDVGIKTDRLSELPIEVMQHILSFLPTKQVFSINSIVHHMETCVDYIPYSEIPFY